jgi:anti-anti-sigma factor
MLPHERRIRRPFMDIEIDRRPRGDTVALLVRGRLDAESADALRQSIDEELRSGFHEITLDLDAVAFLSSAGIRVLFDTHRAAKAAGGSCFIGSASDPVRKVLELTRLAGILMRREHQPQPAAAPTAGTAVERDVTCGPLTLLGLAKPTADVRATLLGSSQPLTGGPCLSIDLPIPRQSFAIGLGSLADGAAAARAGELLAACGAVFHRAPQPFAAIDYLIATGDLVPRIEAVSTFAWDGIPTGRAGFEPAHDEPAVRLDDLATALLDQADAPAIAVVIAADVQGLVGAELIRPLAEATAGDHPLADDRDTVARWLSFSREPMHARLTAIVVGVACRPQPAGPLGGFVRPLGRAGIHGHFHAVVFPHRPLRRGGIDLAATVADLAASTPVGLLHLVGDPQPVLGSGQSEFARGGCWFAPLALASGAAA